MKWLTCSLVFLVPGTVAQAAEVRLGVQAGGLLNTSGGASATEALGSVSVQGALNRSGTFQLRGTLSGGALLSFGAPLRTVPLLRLDADLLNYGSGLYYGGGLGSGLLFDFEDSGGSFPNIVFSPITLLNAHAILGRDFGSYALEATLRAGFYSGASLRASIPLR